MRILPRQTKGVLTSAISMQPRKKSPLPCRHTYKQKRKVKSVLCCRSLQEVLNPESLDVDTVAKVRVLPLCVTHSPAGGTTGVETEGQRHPTAPAPKCLSWECCRQARLALDSYAPGVPSSCGAGLAVGEDQLPGLTTDSGKHTSTMTA